MSKSLAPSPHPRNHHRRVIATHLVLTLYGHWAVNDPRGSGSTDFIDAKFKPLGPIHPGRKFKHKQPTRKELKSFHADHKELLNFPIFWIDHPKREFIAEAIRKTLQAHAYTCYACAICGNHIHLLIRTHKHDALTMWNHFAEQVRSRLRLRLPDKIAPNHPVISSRPHKIFLYTPDDVWDRIDYINENPLKENLAPQRWDFVTPYDNFPFHKQAKAQATPNATRPDPRNRSTNRRSANRDKT